MTHSIRFFVQPRFGEIELNFREMDGIGILGEPHLTAIRAPTLELLRKHLVLAGLPENIATIGDHEAVEVSREQLRMLRFKME